MAQQPFFTSYTPIARMDTRLAGSIGDRIGAGIEQGVQAFAAGIEKKRAKEEKKRQDEQALIFLKAMAPRLGLDPSDEDTLKAGIEGMGGGAEVLRFAAMIQQQEQQAKAQAIRIQQEQQAAQEAAAERTAMLKALGGEGGGDSIARYGAGGGADPRAVQALLGVERARAPAPRPEVLELPGGVRGVWDGNNFSRLPAAGAPMDAPEVREIEGQKFYRGSPEDGWKPLREATAARAGILEQVEESNRKAEAQQLQRQLAEAQAAIAAGRGDEKTGGFLGFGGRTYREVAASAALQLDSLGTGQPPATSESGKIDAKTTLRTQILSEYRSGRISKEEALRRAKEAGIE